MEQNYLNSIKNYCRVYRENDALRLVDVSDAELIFWAVLHRKMTTVHENLKHWIVIDWRALRNTWRYVFDIFNNQVTLGDLCLTLFRHMINFEAGQQSSLQCKMRNKLSLLTNIVISVIGWIKVHCDFWIHWNFVVNLRVESSDFHHIHICDALRQQFFQETL